MLISQRDHLISFIPNWTLQLDISDDGFLTLFDENTNEEKKDVKLPDNEVGEKIRAAFEAEKETSKFIFPIIPIYNAKKKIAVVVLFAMGEWAAIDCKESNKP